MMRPIYWPGVDYFFLIRHFTVNVMHARFTLRETTDKNVVEKGTKLYKKTH